MKFLILPFFFLILKAGAQQLPDSIVITENRFVHNVCLGPRYPPDSIVSSIRYLFVKEQDEYIERGKDAWCLPIKKLMQLTNYPRREYVMIDGVKVDTSWMQDPDKLIMLSKERKVPAGVVKQFMEVINSEEDHSVRLSRFDIDTAAIKAHPERMLLLADNHQQYKWNEQERAFMFPLLTDVENYRKGLNEYVTQPVGENMFSARKQYIITCYIAGKVVNRLTSRRMASGYKSPWSAENGHSNFDYYIDNVVVKMGNVLEDEVLPPLTGDSLLKWIVNGIVKNNAKTLSQLEAYSYEKELGRLTSAFQLVACGRILFPAPDGHWDVEKTMQVILHNDRMLPNVNIEFQAAIKADGICAGDTLLNRYKEMVDRVQGLTFIKDHLLTHPKSELRILFFDNQPVNEVSLMHIKLSSLCEDKLKDGQLLQGIMFDLNDGFLADSHWLLLPDNRVLLYAADVRVMGKTESEDIDGHCLIFNEKGVVISP